MDESHSQDPVSHSINPVSNRRAELAALAILFLKLGTIGFGGPAAHIALFEDEVVRRRRWLTRDEFLDLLGASNLIPGPNSTELEIPFGLWPMFLFFLKVGSVLFGSGYVLLAFLRADLVERWQWLSEAQLLDAIAIGQFTPGPLFTTATFIGYLLGGAPGAIVATVGIFLPAFVFVAISGPLIPRLRESAVAGAVLDGVTVGSLALMAVVTLHLGVAALVDVATVGLAVTAAILLIRFRLNSAWLVLGGAAAGTLIKAI